MSGFSYYCLFSWLEDKPEGLGALWGVNPRRTMKCQNLAPVEREWRDNSEAWIATAQDGPRDDESVIPICIASELRHPSRAGEREEPPRTLNLVPAAADDAANQLVNSGMRSVTADIPPSNSLGRDAQAAKRPAELALFGLDPIPCKCVRTYLEMNNPQKV